MLANEEEKKMKKEDKVEVKVKATESGEKMLNLNSTCKHGLYVRNWLNNPS